MPQILSKPIKPNPPPIEGLWCACWRLRTCQWAWGPYPLGAGRSQHAFVSIICVLCFNNPPSVTILFVCRIPSLFIWLWPVTQSRFVWRWRAIIIVICQHSRPEPRWERRRRALSQLIKLAQDIATMELASTRLICLRLALNFSVFYYEILNPLDHACNLAKQVFD